MITIVTVFTACFHSSHREISHTIVLELAVQGDIYIKIRIESPDFGLPNCLQPFRTVIRREIISIYTYNDTSSISQLTPQLKFVNTRRPGLRGHDAPLCLHRACPRCCAHECVLERLRVLQDPSFGACVVRATRLRSLSTPRRAVDLRLWRVHHPPRAHHWSHWRWGGKTRAKRR